MSNNKPHGFCETPEEKCTMNYCDENGCINRKRNPVGDGDPIEMSNNKQSSVEWLFEQYKLIGMLTTAQFEKAQAMHKDEHGKTWDNSMDNLELRGGNHIRAWVDFDEYYNETYGGNNEQQ